MKERLHRLVSVPIMGCAVGVGAYIFVMWVIKLVTST